MKRTFILDYDNTIIHNPYYSSFIHLPLIGRLFPKRYQLADGVRDILKSLKDRGDNVVILTKTTVLPKRKKMEKIKGSGIMEMVDDVMVVRKKGRDVINRIKGKYPSERYYMVGNSFRKDINPALLSNVTPVYIPRGLGEGRKKIRGVKGRDRVFLLHSLKEITSLP